MRGVLEAEESRGWKDRGIGARGAANQGCVQIIEDGDSAAP